MANLPFLLLGAAVIVAFVVYVRGRTDGAKLERAKSDEAEIEAIKVADQIDSDPLPADVAREELKRWGK